MAAPAQRDVFYRFFLGKDDCSPKLPEDGNEDLGQLARVAQDCYHKVFNSSFTLIGGLQQYEVQSIGVLKSGEESWTCHRAEAQLTSSNLVVILPKDYLLEQTPQDFPYKESSGQAIEGADTDGVRYVLDLPQKTFREVIGNTARIYRWQ